MNAERVLKIAVIAMGVLIFILLGVVVWRIGTLAEDGDDPAQALAADPAADVALGLAPGCRIAAATADAGRLVIHASGPSRACDAVYLFDLETGARITAITP